MRTSEIIRKKQHREPLTEAEIAFVVDGLTAGDIPDYQLSALLMAVWYSGMTVEETTALTLAMARSGEMVDLSAVDGVPVDKHSTGGVADTTTLIVAPVVAACGGRIAKMSGRGLGHTGGTLDKLESIPGFRVDLSSGEFIDTVNRCGVSIIGQTGNLVPADKKLYALRDVTATVDSIPLIASSIMSKKLASGASAIVLDVKAGSGAFMKETDSARELARAMVSIGELAGRRTVALVTDMNQPLGSAVGNALDVAEAVGVLRGDGSGDLLEVSLALASELLVLGGVARDLEEAASAARGAIGSGDALERLARMIELQHGDPRVVDDLLILPRSHSRVEVHAAASGFVSRIDAELIGTAAQLLGAGRARKDDPVDPAVGIEVLRRLGDEVSIGEPLFRLHVNDEKSLAEVERRCLASIAVSDRPPEPAPGIILDRIAPS